eukprot:Pgem_evm1s18861
MLLFNAFLLLIPIISTITSGVDVSCGKIGSRHAFNLNGDGKLTSNLGYGKSCDI